MIKLTELMNEANMATVFGDTDKRQLNWISPKAYSINGVVAAFKKALPGGYNEFKADRLKVLGKIFKNPNSVKVYPARENSVAVYVQGELEDGWYGAPIKKALKADEFNRDKTKFGFTTYRIWWD